MIQPFTYTALTTGTKFLVLGAVHGNETCGTVAIKRVMAELDSGALVLARGQVTFVPVCNPRAYAAHTRWSERNLNRYLVPMEVPDCYESQLGNILCPMLAACDVLLDIHSYTAGGAPFLVATNKPNALENEFFSCLGADAVLCGWNDAYATTSHKTTDANSEESTGTTEYARRHGAMTVTMECGQHDDPQSIEIAYRAIHNALRHLGIVEGCAVVIASSRILTMKKVYYQDGEGTFTKPFANFESVIKDQIIATRKDGEKVLAPDDGVIIMPKPAAKVGEEWFYWGMVDAPSNPCLSAIK